MKYTFPKVIQTSSGKKAKEIKYKAIPLLAITYLLKRLYGKAYIYLNMKKLAPLLIRPHKPEEIGEGYEGLIVPSYELYR